MSSGGQGSRTSESTCVLGARLSAAIGYRRRRSQRRRRQRRGSRYWRPAANDQHRATRIGAVTIYDRSQTIIHSVIDVQMTLAFVLVVLVIFMFLGRAKDTLIPAMVFAPLLITFIAMELLGYSLDNLSLMALTLAIGFLVDDAIVFLENTVRRMERGEKALEATINSAKEISFTIVSMTISLARSSSPWYLCPAWWAASFSDHHCYRDHRIGFGVAHADAAHVRKAAKGAW